MFIANNHVSFQCGEKKFGQTSENKTKKLTIKYRKKYRSKKQTTMMYHDASSIHKKYTLLFSFL